MANKMLIDATHPEETRVVVVRGSRVEEFDFEAANRKQLRGNIYLAKVTRVEPSLQAAFVDYGGNRHGFLAFSEIHPDYYQIPTADRQALLEEEARMHADAEREENRPRRKSKPKAKAESEGAEGEEVSEAADSEAEIADEEAVESVGSEDALEELPERRPQQRLRRQYKIQEVIKRRQVLLVQVVKEERGNKGAALTTYLSLAGRYSVLMPNTARGGGISRKITQPTDRKRLKTIAQELEVPEGMGVIVRTAGAARTKAEIKRDFEYLLRLWENVRELTLKSSAPKLVYEEGSLIKRSIRDLYNKDIDEVLVAGEEGYREAKDFMRMLMPSHAKNVQNYREPTPVFTRFAVESQLDAMFSPQVTLRSGGYIVINPTEALVSIDVNSGKSTREHNIEDTALATNMEAAEEVARQLRLRDLAGLIVIDFIDMEENRNNRAVERKLKECLKNDRARIQVGRISHFGLMEMSRQRIRTGVLESSMVLCPHCGGTGMVRSTESVALHVLRSLEEALLRSVTHDLIVRTRTAVALYILNNKRGHLADLERRFGLDITVLADDHASQAGHLYVVEKGDPVVPRTDRPELVAAPAPVEEPEEEIVEDEIEETEEEETERAESRDEGRGDAARAAETEAGRRRRRRRRRGRGRGEGAPQNGTDEENAAYDAENGAEEGGEEGSEETGPVELDANGDEIPRKRRRRGRRGGRRNRPENGEAGETVRAEGETYEGEESDEGEELATDDVVVIDRETLAAEVEAMDAAPEETAAEVVAEEAPTVEAPVTEAAAAEVPAEEPPAKPKRVRAPRKSAKTKAAEAAAAEAEAAAAETETEAAPAVAEEPAPAPEQPASEASAATATQSVSEPAPVEEAEAEPAAPAKPVPQSTELPPDAPRKSGWWSKRG
ncbi:Rne/Rng family ribonuclease [Pinisolibacter aquiterrae]|uniref:Rne/Rng family ribonuclease n=1 Tax=Pinisolibacter aquiterrae TaxID=2815579 RepID=UPI001C3D531F|nr:ribonuclease E/G [Pinisolibacter aquiterrae]MBV5264946.1 ribonuclease E/G [Pinisolibacter aquiterrae]MCC8235672.1 ribonuclease E/G [Pinisolibacter aquiterrae]